MVSSLDFPGMSKWLGTQLRSSEVKVIESEYPEYWGFDGKHHSAKDTLPLGLQELVSAQLSETGRAVNYIGQATTIPLANAGLAFGSVKTALGIIGSEVNYFQLEREKVAQAYPSAGLNYFNLVKTLRDSMERSLREWMHLKAVFGDKNLAMGGLLTNSSVPIVAETVRVSGLTPEALYEWVLTKINQFKEQNLLTTNEQVSILCSSQVSLAMDRRFTDGGGGTAGDLLKAKVKEVTEINELSTPYLEQFGVTNVGSNLEMLTIYQNDESVLERFYHPIITTEPKLLDDCVTYRMVAFCATSEVRFNKPKKAMYITYPK